jgi:nucleotide-binding universal stress UspA family protein
MTAAGLGPIVFAYDGSELARGAIGEAARQFGPGRAAIVLTVWRPADVGFVPPAELEIDAARRDEVKRAAEATAADGASLAEAAGFRAQSATTEAVPTWKGIVDFAENHDASLIVLGSHGRSGLATVLIGSVAAAVAAHCATPVLIAHRRG